MYSMTETEGGGSTKQDICRRKAGETCRDCQCCHYILLSFFLLIQAFGAIASSLWPSQKLQHTQSVKLLQQHLLAILLTDCVPDGIFLELVPKSICCQGKHVVFHKLLNVVAADNLRTPGDEQESRDKARCPSSHPHTTIDPSKTFERATRSSASNVFIIESC